MDSEGSGDFRSVQSRREGQLNEGSREGGDKKERMGELPFSLVSHSIGEKGKHRCELCRRSFDTLSELRTHDTDSVQHTRLSRYFSVFQDEWIIATFRNHSIERSDDRSSDLSGLIYLKCQLCDLMLPEKISQIDHFYDEHHTHKVLEHHLPHPKQQRFLFVARDQRSYACEACHKSFEHICPVLMHQITEEHRSQLAKFKDLSYSCDLCKITDMSPKSLAYHCRSPEHIINEEGRSTEEICQAIKSPLSLKSIIFNRGWLTDRESSNIFYCEVCDVEMNYRPRLLMDHLSSEKHRFCFKRERDPSLASAGTAHPSTTSARTSVTPGERSTIIEAESGMDEKDKEDEDLGIDPIKVRRMHEEFERRLKMPYQLKELIEHRDQPSLIDQITLDCHCCRWRSPNRFALKSHCQDFIHQQRSKALRKYFSMSIDKVTMADRDAYYCKKCDHLINDRFNVIPHYYTAMHHRNVLDARLKKEETIGIRIHHDILKSPYECQLCQKLLFNLGMVVGHIEKHSHFANLLKYNKKDHSFGMH